MRKTLLMGAALAAATGAAHADPVLGVYLGAGVIQSDVDNALNTNLDIHDHEYKVFAGIHPLASPIGFEAQYLDLGSRSNGIVSAQSQAWAYDAIIKVPLPLPLLNLYGKAGIARDEVSGTLLGRIPLGVDDSATQFTYGAGVQLNAGSFGVRLEYEHFPLIRTDGANVYTLGVLFTFL